MLKFSKTV